MNREALKKLRKDADDIHNLIILSGKLPMSHNEKLMWSQIYTFLSNLISALLSNE